MMCKSVRQYTLRDLHKHFQGKCQRCFADTKIVHVVQRIGGWTLHGDPENVSRVTSPFGKTFRVATIEHLWPKFYGGPDLPWNLTLFCWDCNQATSRMTPRQLLRRLDAEFWSKEREKVA